MQFEQSPKRCYLCCKEFCGAVKPIPVVGGMCAPGYICPACYSKLLERDEQESTRKADA